MSQFIELTILKGGAKIVLNKDHIVAVRPADTNGVANTFIITSVVHGEQHQRLTFNVSEAYADVAKVLV